MKIRTGFVSNSSSSSFICNLKTCKGDVEKFLSRLKKMSDNHTDEDDCSWFGNESYISSKNYLQEGNFVHIGSHNAPSGLYRLVEEYFDKADIYQVE